MATDPHLPISSDGKDDFWKQLVAYAQADRSYVPLFGEYRTLQRLNLIHIQTELSRIKADAFEHQTTSSEQMLALRRLLHEVGVRPP